MAASIWDARSMAKIWPCYDNDATMHLWGERSINWCEERLGLSPCDYRCALEQFGPRGSLQTEPDYTHVVVEVSDDEAASDANGWKPGIYDVLLLSPEAVHQRLSVSPKMLVLPHL
jgi:hypothetical protein